MRKKFCVSKLRRQLKENGDKIAFSELPAIPQTIFQLDDCRIVTLKLKKWGPLEEQDFENFYMLTSLRKLSVIACGLKCFPKGILKMEMLEELNLKQNSIESIDEGASSLKNLSSLDLSHNNLKAISKGSLEQLYNLFAIYITDTGEFKLGKPALKVIMACKRLCILRINELSNELWNTLTPREQERFDAITLAEDKTFVIPFTEESSHIEIENYAKAYKMNSRPKGLAIIINIKSFENQAIRRGSEKDVTKLRAFFENTGFDTVYHPRDYTAEEAMKFLQKYATKTKYGSCDCIAVILMSYGDKSGLIFHYGKKVSVMGLVECIEESLLYRGKPKWFFIQSEMATGCSTNVSTDVTDSAPFSSDISRGADILISYSTSESHTSFRNLSHGSWYVQVFVETFSQHAWEEDVLSLLTLVNYKVARAHSSAEWTQVPGPQSTLRKKLFLLPGFTKPT